MPLHSVQRRLGAWHSATVACSSGPGVALSGYLHLSMCPTDMKREGYSRDAQTRRCAQGTACSFTVWRWPEAQHRD